MGQQQSSEKAERTTSRGSDQQKKVNRRQSIQTLPISKGRASPSNPSASIANATAQTTRSGHLDTPALQHYLHTSPEASKTSGTLGRSRSTREKKDDPSPTDKSPLSQPVPVPPTPIPIKVPTAKSKPDDFDGKAFSKDFREEDYEERRYVPSSQLRPPRLPLPIADAVIPIPESPSLDPIDKGTADVPSMHDDAGLAGEAPQLRRRSSMVSQTTLDDDEDVGDELPPVDPTQQTVPHTIEWNKSGYRVYVTGTFANWEKKFRLHHNKDRHGLSTTLHLPPGTHHLMFLVDETMMTNPDLPTAVDFNNVLVNYIEVATEDVGSGRRHSQQPADGKRDSIQIDRPEAVPEEAAESGDESPAEDESVTFAEEVPPGDFRTLLPQALYDMDLTDESDPRYIQATQVIGELGAPPSLPMFLSRSILNGITPVKDDSSVLVLPNHTVLNHLMTSSVKNGVLATSVTTRYKKKYVTTISFKPVPKPKPIPPFNQG